MKKQLHIVLKTIVAIFFTHLITSASVFAQLSGTYTIDNTLAASATNYKNFTSAADDLSSGTRTDGGTAHGPGASGSVTFNVKAGETFSESPVTITYTNSSHYTIIFQNSGTPGINNPILQGTNGTSDTDAIIKLLGAGYYTFNGINFSDNTSNVTPTTEMEYGIYLSGLSASGCQHNTFENGTVTLNKTNTNLPIGVYTNSDATSAAGANSSNTFTNLIVQNVITGYSLNGNSGFGGTSDNGNTINSTDNGRSEITNVGPSTANNGTVAEGIFFTGETGLTISNININNLTYYNTSTAGDIYGIIEGGSGFTILAGNVTINEDTIESLALAKGSSATATIWGIYLGTVTSTTNITNCLLTNFSNTVGGSSIYGIDMEAAVVSLTTVNISGNTFSNFNNSGGDILGFNDGPIGDLTNTINIFNNNFSGFTCNTAGAYTAYCVQLSSQALSFHNNKLSSFTGGTGDGLSSGGVTGLYLVGPTDKLAAFHDDTLTGFTAPSTVIGLDEGISGQPGIPIYNCVLSNFSTTTTGEAYTVGLSLSDPTDTIYDNYIHTFTDSSENGQVVALYVGSAPDSLTSSAIYNNMIYDLQANSSTLSTAGGAVVGIELPDVSTGDAVVKLYYNTVFLNGTSRVTGQYSSALFIGTNNEYPTLPNAFDIRNNILVNDYGVRDANDHAVAVWYNVLNTNFQGIATTTNNNLLYAGAPSVKNLIFYCKGVDSVQTLAAYKTLLGGGKESKSVTENPPFKSVVSPINVHINNTIYTQAESGGQVITSPPINTDIDGNIRVGSSGYTGCGSAPDIGANEFCGIPDTAFGIRGPGSIQPGEVGVKFFVSPPIPDATGYNWTLSGGATITAGANTDTITVSFSGVDTGKYPITVYGTNCCGNGVSQTDTIGVGVTTGINQAYSNNQLSVYPNPNNGQMIVNLTGSDCISMKIFDEIGREVYVQPLDALQQNKNLAINIGNVSSGVYFLQLQTERGIVSRKIVVQR